MDESIWLAPASFAQRSWNQTLQKSPELCICKTMPFLTCENMYWAGRCKEIATRMLWGNEILLCRSSLRLELDLFFWPALSYFVSDKSTVKNHTSPYWRNKMRRYFFQDAMIWINNNSSLCFSPQNYPKTRSTAQLIFSSKNSWECFGRWVLSMCYLDPVIWAERDGASRIWANAF
jgi:hypothetical protein